MPSAAQVDILTPGLGLGTLRSTNWSFSIILRRKASSCGRTRAWEGCCLVRWCPGPIRPCRSPWRWWPLKVKSSIMTNELITDSSPTAVESNLCLCVVGSSIAVIHTRHLNWVTPPYYIESIIVTNLHNSHGASMSPSSASSVRLSIGGSGMSLTGSMKVQCWNYNYKL